jgi:hypothetical protein
MESARNATILTTIAGADASATYAIGELKHGAHLREPLVREECAEEPHRAASSSRVRVFQRSAPACFISARPARRRR